MHRLSRVLLIVLLASALPLTAEGTPGGESATDAPVERDQGSPPSGAPGLDTRALISDLDRLFHEGRRAEAELAYEQLTGVRADAVAIGLELLSGDGAASQQTVMALCSLASEEVPAEMGRSVLEQVLPSSTLDDQTKRVCIKGLADSLDGRFRSPLEHLSTEAGRDPNLRIAALKVATSKWPLESHPTLVQLLQSAQEPIMHHKAQQYLVYSGHAETDTLIEQFVLNRDPATAGKALSKEYGLLLLRFRQEERVLPLLDSILRDETWPGEIQDRAIDLLANSGLPGGRVLLSDVRGEASDRLKSRIDALVRESE